jgi:hypothetical protein
VQEEKAKTSRKLKKALKKAHADRTAVSAVIALVADARCCSRPRTLARPLSDRCGRGAVQEEKAKTSRKISKAISILNEGNQYSKTFTDADDQRLRELVDIFDFQWPRIGEAMGRSRSSVETRWVNYLRPECEACKNTGNWTKGEDDLLISAVSEHQTNPKINFLHIEVRPKLYMYFVAP